MSFIKITDRAKNIIINYDSIDLLATLGAINLSFDNQNKNYATSYYSTYVLLNQNHEKPRASRKTLTLLTEEMNDSKIIMPIQDPPEAPFFQKILFDRDYSVFNGVDHHAAFFASRLSELLLLSNQSSLPKPFITILKRITKAVLSISDTVFTKLNIKYDDVSKYRGDKDILLPENIEYLKALLYIDKSYLYQLGLSEEDIQRYLVFHYSPLLNLASCLDKEIPYYFARPFVDCDDRLLLVDPTAINTYIRFFSIELAEAFKCKDIFVDEMNKIIFEWGEWQLRKSILRYDSGKSFLQNINYANNKTYKEKIVQFSKTKLILYSACFGNETEGKTLKIDVDKHHKNINKQLKELDDEYEVINVTLCYTYGIGLHVRESTVFKNNSIVLTFDEFESFVINEKHKVCALFDAINFVQVTKGVFPLTMGAINRIAFLHNCNYNFYLDDNTDAYSTNLFVGFEFTYTYRMLAAKEEATFVAPFYNQLLLLEKDCDNVYYVNTRFFDNKIMITYNRYPCGGFWVYSKILDYQVYTFLGIINYWLTNLQKLLAKDIKKQFYIEMMADDNEQGIVCMVEKTCLVNLAPIFAMVNSNGIFDEIDLVLRVLESLGILSPSIKKQLEEERLNPFKRYNTPIRTDQIMLMPFKKQLNPVFVSKYKSYLFDDAAGRDYAIKECGILPGNAISNADSFLKGLVEKFFKDLDKLSRDFDWLASVKYMYEYQEDYLQKILINKKTLKAKHSLHSKHIDDINAIYYDLNSASPCIRFLIQFFATMQYEGNKTMDECDLEALMTLVHSIIHFANIDDGVMFKILPDSMTLLQSKRLDIDLTNLDIFNKFISKEIINDSINDFAFYDNQKWPFNQELNEAYNEEYGFSFDQMVTVAALLIAIGEKQDEEIKQTTIKEVLDKSKGANYLNIIIDKQTVVKIISHLSLQKRDSFFDSTIKNKRDLYPWRYNRTESITRKPLVKYGDNLIWGNRTLYQCIVFTWEHICDGTEPTKNHSRGKLKTLNGKILELKGKRFNEMAIDYLTKNIPDIVFYKGQTSFNNKRMTNDRGEFLGDIDILGIDYHKHRIYLIEAKNYQYSKNMAEFGLEQEDFYGSNKKKGFVEKELNRVNWVKSHLEDVKKEFKLDDGSWQVLYTFLSSEPLLCSIFGDVHFNNVSIENINKKYLNSLIEQN